MNLNGELYAASAINLLYTYKLTINCGYWQIEKDKLV